MKIKQGKTTKFTTRYFVSYPEPEKGVKDLFSKTLKVKIKLTFGTCPTLYYICQEFF